jgi:hypothetical protein
MRAVAAILTRSKSLIERAPREQGLALEIVSSAGQLKGGGCGGGGVRAQVVHRLA